MHRPLLTPAQARHLAQSINDPWTGERRHEPRMKLTLACRERERIEDERVVMGAIKEVWE